MRFAIFEQAISSTVAADTSRIDSGTPAPILATGSRIDPIASFHASVSRTMADGRKFHPAQAMTRAEALASEAFLEPYHTHATHPQILDAVQHHRLHGFLLGFPARL